MKTFILTILIFISFSAHCQENITPKLQGCFAAIIVKDMPTSVEWYKKVLNLKEISRNKNAKMELEQVNLKNDLLHIELIYLKSAISPQALNNKRQRHTGLFKIGVRLDNIGQWIIHLKSKKIVQEQDIVVNPVSKKKMFVIKDPDGNRIQFFEG